MDIAHALPEPDVVDVLGAVTAAEKVAHHRTHNLAVLVARRHAAATKILIYRALDGLELACHEINSGLPELGVIDMELSAKCYLADKSSEMIFRCLRVDI